MGERESIWICLCCGAATHAPRSEDAVQLKAWREASGLHPEDVAEAVGVCRRTYDRWEHGDTLPYREMEPTILEVILGERPVKRRRIVSRPAPHEQAEALARLLDWMKRTGTGSTETARALGLGTTTLYAWKKGITAPSAASIEAINALLGGGET